MANKHIIERLDGIQKVLMGVHAAGASMSASSKGQERQQFIDSFLAHALPPIYRFGTGDATDAAGNRSGQLDVVIEHPFAPTLPIGADKPTRLYLAESVAAVVEVKSDLSSQWGEAKRTAELLAPVTRTFGATISLGAGLMLGGGGRQMVPLYLVGYKGWKTAATVREKLAECPNVAGILVIDGGFFCSADVEAEGAHGLWAFICHLYHQISSVQGAATYPLSYIDPPKITGTVSTSITASPNVNYDFSTSGIATGGTGFGSTSK